jgi:hypothetical protein
MTNSYNWVTWRLGAQIPPSPFFSSKNLKPYITFLVFMPGERLTFKQIEEVVKEAFQPIHDDLRERVERSHRIADGYAQMSADLRDSSSRRREPTHTTRLKPDRSMTARQQLAVLEYYHGVVPTAVQIERSYDAIVEGHTYNLLRPPGGYEWERNVGAFMQESAWDE